MDIILDLQKLAIPDNEYFFGNSCSSSDTNCCNGTSTPTLGGGGL